MPEFADSQLAAFIAANNDLNPPSSADTGADALRAATLERAAARPKGPKLHSVDDVAITAHGPTVRIYRPIVGTTGVLVYFQGGGFVIGDLDTHDRACRRLADSSGVVVVATDYRRAPEHRWPAAVDDALAVIGWVTTNPPALGDLNGRLGVGGDSAGGLLAALTTNRLRDDSSGLLPVAQFLIYANTDLTSTGGSMDTEGHGYGVDVADIEWSMSQWVPDKARWADPSVSPLLADDLAGLPLTFVVTCEHDPLRDQGEQYADRLKQAGVATVMRREPGMVHNFMLWDLISPACGIAADRVAADVKSALGNPTNRLQG